MRLTRTVFRAHNPRWSFAPDSGEGAALTGGRFNRVGLPALYTALRFETAWLEAQQAFPFKAQPMTLCAYEVDCDDVLDLTEAGVLAAHGIVPDDLACAWKDLATRNLVPASWAMADRLVGQGCAGIVVPSFASGATVLDRNAVFWRWNPDRPHRVRVIDDFARLPRSGASWNG
ncbi:RES family NAD+ phosphorylase [Rhizosaccharibacter radicis]|uniref:RES domain-containing protein n=1 Tax=Rhizosaccharibacter radicis TaxID=2782605 RepID=A0ABT1W0R3_9PROT|nr:RES domain-containing protein [Acetobacteraceae bacterium KSS12]